MSVITQVTVRDVTVEQYDAVRAACGWLTEQPAGGQCHLTWFDGTTCYSVDAWESEATFATFAAERLGPAMAAVGITQQPEVTIYPAHEVFLPRALTETATIALPGQRIDITEPIGTPTS